MASMRQVTSARLGCRTGATFHLGEGDRRDQAVGMPVLGHGQGGKPVEMIVEDAEFVTMAPASRAESMLVRDGRITAVGPAAAVRAAAGPGAAVVRLDGATVIPGLIDAHCHVMNVGYLAAGAD